MDEREKIQKELLKEHPILDLVSFNEIDMQEKLKENAFLLVKYQDFYNTENKIYEELMEMYESLEGSRYDHYRFHEDKSLTKVEIEKYYLVNDKEIRQMKRILRKQMVRVEFFDMCIKGLKQMGWNMKVFSDNERRGL